MTTPSPNAHDNASNTNKDPLNVNFEQVDATKAASAHAAEVLVKNTQSLNAQNTVHPKFKALLQDGVKLMNAEQYDEAAQQALAALEMDERSPIAWQLLAICMERLSFTARAISCYEKVLELDPDINETYHNLGLLAWRLELHDAALQFLQIYMAREPDSIDGPNNFASVLRDMGRYEDAIEVLRSAILSHEDSHLLWNSLGTILNDCGQLEDALTFYDEAIRLKPDFARAYFNRGNAKLFLGPLEGALQDFDKALENPDSDYDKMHMSYARAQCLLAMGNLKEGWPAYEARMDPRYPGAAKFVLPLTRWQPEDGLEGKRFVLVGEQGLGDEVMFLSVLADMKKAIGPEGKLSVACERRLVPLLKAVHQDIEFGPHLTIRDNGQPARLVPWVSARPQEFDCWAPMASVMATLRPTLKSFPKKAFFKPNKKRSSAWKQELTHGKDVPLIGLAWKSLKTDAKRSRFYAPFEHMGPLFDTPVKFVCLQYGDVEAEIEYARKHFGVDILLPEDIDLRNDLENLTDLASAMDLVIGPMNASTNLAMAAGVETWIMDGSGLAWAYLGERTSIPWYKDGRVFWPETQSQWEPLIADMASELKSRYTPKGRRRKIA